MRIVFTVLLFLITGVATADQFLIASASEAKELFWSKLYPGAGWTLYCGDYFQSKTRVDIEHIYSLSWAAKALRCSDIEQCQRDNPRFNRIAADLHNLYPARPMIIRARKDYHFGLIPGEFREFFECDFENSVHDRIVEPRLSARGNIARALFYMRAQYGLPIGADMLGLLKEWNLADPPSKDEVRRNEVIERLQGTRNTFIDNPRLANVLLDNSRINNAPTDTAQRERDIQFLQTF